MNKTKFLALIAFAAILSACGSDDSGGGPPSLKNKNIGFISPFDTLEVEFDSDIVNKNEIKESDITSSTNIVRVSPQKEKKNSLYFIGGELTPGGSSYFASNLANASIIFSNLKNSDGYVRDSKNPITFSFSTYQILDKISGKNDQLDSAVDLEPFFSNVNQISFAGILDGMTGPSTVNMQDFYKIQLRMNDVLKISAKSKDTLYINIKEPGKNSVNEFYGVSTKKDSVFTLTVGGKHLDPTDISGKLVDFYIIVNAIGVNYQSNPYTLSISRSRN